MVPTDIVGGLTVQQGVIPGGVVQQTHHGVQGEGPGLMGQVLSGGGGYGKTLAPLHFLSLGRESSSFTYVQCIGSAKCMLHFFTNSG